MASGSYIDIEAADGGRLRAYLAQPAQGSGPGLVLVHEILGINDFMRAMADRYAEEGYVCLVPDLFWRLEAAVDLGYSESELERGAVLRARFDVEQGVRDVDATREALRALPAQRGKVGIVGWSMGGLIASLAAARLELEDRKSVV